LILSHGESGSKNVLSGQQINECPRPQGGAFLFWSVAGLAWAKAQKQEWE